MNKVYRTKSKLFGYQIGLNNDNLYCAVPAKYFKDNSIQIVCEELTRTVLDTDRENETTFKDKYNPNKNYLLYYFKLKEYSK